MNNNRKCIICNTEYRYCNTCNEDKNKPSWMTLFDKEDCYEIYRICINYRDGKITVDEAKKRLKSLDLTNIEEFGEGIKNMINKILKTEKVIEKETTIKEIKDEKVSNFQTKTKK